MYAELEMIVKKNCDIQYLSFYLPGRTEENQKQVS